jgi:hypothetical protein
VSVDSLGFPVAYLYNGAANFNLENLSAAEKSARKFQALDTEHERPQVYLLLGDILAMLTMLRRSKNKSKSWKSSDGEE